MKEPINWNQMLVVVGISLVVGIGGIGLFLPQKGFSESENRYLQKRPDFSWSKILDGSYGTEYEAYLGDQFPGRDAWVGLKTMSERIMGKTHANGVYFGKSGYLMEKFETEDLEGDQLWTNVEILSQALGRMVETWGEDHVRAMFVPGASQVLTSKLPPFAVPYDQQKITNLFQTEEDRMGIMVPIEEALKKHGEEPLYYETDHHWTTLGAYYGYVAWMESRGMEPWKKEAFQETVLSEDFLGTLHSKVQGGKNLDTITIYEPKTPIEFQVEYDESGIWTPGLYSYDALATRDQYSVFLDGNHGLTRIQNQSDKNGKKLLIIKDSYAHSFAPFAANHFEETLLVDLRYYNGDVETFAREEKVTDILVLYRIPGLGLEKTISKLR